LTGITLSSAQNVVTYISLSLKCHVGHANSLHHALFFQWHIRSIQFVQWQTNLVGLKLMETA